jgi:hypothetical protein
MHNAFMGDASNRLIHARLTAGYRTAVEAADAMRLPHPTYLAHENGSRGFARVAGRYADFYRVHLDWLLNNRGPMRRGTQSEIERLFERIRPELRREAFEYLEYLASKR